MKQNFNVCMISKFPPIEGGMSAKAFWLATGIAKRGVQTTVLTNSNATEKEHLINGCEVKEQWNLKIEKIFLNDQFYIPHRDLDIAAFLDKAIKIIKRDRIDVIDAHYLIPYGIVAYLAHKILGVPYIIRHGGSDINKFLNKKTFEDLLERVLSEAAIVETSDSLVMAKSKKTVRLSPYVPDEFFFNPVPIKKVIDKKIRIAYIGKINKLWHYKRLDKIIEFFGKSPDKFELIFLAQGLGMNDFRAKNDVAQTKILDFIPPWNMPEFYKNIDYIICLVEDNPLPDWPNIVPEALLSGVKIITDNKLFFEKFNMPLKLVEKTVFQINIDNENFNLYDLLYKFKSREEIKILESYDSYIGKNINLYREIIQ